MTFTDIMNKLFAKEKPTLKQDIESLEKNIEGLSELGLLKGAHLDMQGAKRHLIHRYAKNDPVLYERLSNPESPTLSERVQNNISHFERQNLRRGFPAVNYEADKNLGAAALTINNVLGPVLKPYDYDSRRMRFWEHLLTGSVQFLTLTAAAAESYFAMGIEPSGALSQAGRYVLQAAIPVAAPFASYEYLRHLRPRSIEEKRKNLIDHSRKADSVIENYYRHIIDITKIDAFQNERSEAV